MSLSYICEEPKRFHFARIALDAVHEERTACGMPLLKFIACVKRLTINEQEVDFDVATFDFPAGPSAFAISTQLIDDPWKRPDSHGSLATSLVDSKKAYIVAAVRHAMGHVWMSHVRSSFMLLLDEFEGIYTDEKVCAIHYGTPLPSGYAHGNLYEFFAESYVAWRSEFADLLPKGIAEYFVELQKLAALVSDNSAPNADTDSDEPPSMLSIDHFSSKVGSSIFWFTADGDPYECQKAKNPLYSVIEEYQ